MLRKRKIFLIILPLLVLNIALIVNIFWAKKAQTASKPTCYNKEKLSIYPQAEFIAEKVECHDCEPVLKGKILFGYYGEETNCFAKRAGSKTITPEEYECYEKYPYGSMGTFIMGGNLVVNSAKALYFNNNDRAGYHWLMSTTTEPLGNIMGFRKNTEDIMFGNNVVVNGDMIIKKGNIIYYGGNSIRFQLGDFKVDDSSNLQTIDMIAFNNNRLKILESSVCGRDQGSCSGGEAGSGYKFLTDNGIRVKGTLKADKAIRLKGDKNPGDDYYSVKYKDFLIPLWTGENFNFTKEHDNRFSDGKARDEEFVVAECKGLEEYCSPQPYPHYKTCKRVIKECLY